MGCAKVVSNTARMVPKIVPIPSAVREIREDSASSFCAYDLAIKLVAVIDKNKRGMGALLLILDDGPSAASLMDINSQPMKSASIRDMSGGQTYIPKAGTANTRHLREVGVGG